jgi:hypothetical protein
LLSTFWANWYDMQGGASAEKADALSRRHPSPVMHQARQRAVGHFTACRRRRPSPAAEESAAPSISILIAWFVVKSSEDKCGSTAIRATKRKTRSSLGLPAPVAIDSEPKIASFSFGSVPQNEAGVARPKLNGHFIDQIGAASDSWSHQWL